MKRYFVYTPKGVVGLRADSIRTIGCLSSNDPVRVEFWANRELVGSFVLANIFGYALRGFAKEAKPHVVDGDHDRRQESDHEQQTEKIE